MCTRSAIALYVVLSCFILAPASWHCVSGAEPIVGWPDEDVVPADPDWKDVPPAERLGVLGLLETATRANYEKISTLQATYFVHSEQYLDPQFVTGGFRARLPEKCTPDLLQESEYLFKYCVRMSDGSVFRSREPSIFRLLTTDTRDPIVVPGVRAMAPRSVVTGKDYIYWDVSAPPATYAVCQDHPLAMNKRAAHRVAPEEAIGKDHGELMDIRQFYCCANSSKCWDELSLYASVLRGDKGPESQAELSATLSVDTASDDGRRWYRLRQPVRTRDGVKNIVTSIWSSEFGYNPVYMSFAEQDEAAGTIRTVRQWRWNMVDGTFLPALVREAWRPKVPGHVNTFLRIAEMRDAILNAEIPDSQFTVEALGLSDGDLVLDELEATVYAVGPGGLSRIARFSEPYTPNQADGGRFGVAALAVVNAAVVLCIGLAVWYRRRVRARGHG